MVAKINIGNSLYGALSYNQEKVDEGAGKILTSHLVHVPADGKFNVPALMEDFLRWMPSPEHLPTAKPVIHISINPHPEDKLSDEQLSDIGREYMEKLGYGGQPYVVFKHSDIEREHIHIVSLRVDSGGKLIKDSFERKRCTEISRQLEQQYNLHLVDGKKQGEGWQFSPIDISKGNLKRQIAAVIKPAASMYHFQTMGEYRALLSIYNTGVDEVKGELHGKPYRGLVYSALDESGNKAGTPLKSSLFGKSVGYDALEKHFEKSKEQIKQHGFREKTRIAVGDALRNSRNEKGFRAALQEKGIDLVLRKNEEGRIYGATFIDHNERCVLNGSRLGKEFSANVLNERFEGEQTGSIDTDTQEIVTDTRQPAQADNHPSHSAIDGVVDGLGSLFSIFSSGPDTDDIRPLKKKSKKKKRRYGRQM
ncbi:mobilization protein [Bacteroidia bacterium]|nr:mobilization protein [Bacteroidia bacterium]